MVPPTPDHLFMDSVCGLLHPADAFEILYPVHPRPSPDKAHSGRARLGRPSAQASTGHLTSQRLGSSLIKWGC